MYAKDVPHGVVLSWLVELMIFFIVVPIHVVHGDLVLEWQRKGMRTYMVDVLMERSQSSRAAPSG